MAIYYVRADGTAAKAAAVGPVGDNTKCMSMATLNASTFAAGDVIYFSALGGNYTTQFSVPSSGASGNPIIYQPAPGETPQIDMSGNAANAYCILLNNITYVTIGNTTDRIELKGSGGGACVRLINNSGVGGKTARFYNIDVLSNYGASDVTDAHDGFSLTNAAEAYFSGCTATKCRENPSAGGPHQCLTTHNTSIAEWHGGTMSDSNYWTYCVESSVCDIYDCTMTTPLVAGTDSNNTARVTLHNCTCTSNTVILAAAGAAGGTGTGSIVRFNSCTLTDTSGGSRLLQGQLYFNECTIIINGATAFYRTLIPGSKFTADKCDITITNSSTYWLTGSAGDDGQYTITRNRITVATTDGFIQVHVDNIEARIQGNLFYSCSSTQPINIVSGGKFNRLVDRNTFYSCTRGVKVSGAPVSGVVVVRSNIFHTVTLSIDGVANCTPSYNCYYNSSNQGGEKSKIQNPNFIDLVDFQIRKTSPCYNAGRNVGLTEDAFGNPITTKFSMGWYEPPADVSTASTITIIRTLQRRRKIMATRNYPISDIWLRTTDPNAPTYCDIQEIRNDPHGNVIQPDNVLHGAPNYSSSSYLTWVLANDPKVFTLENGNAPSRADHIAAALFTDTGSRVGETDNGNNIKGVLKDSNLITTGRFFAGINHGEIYRRIYREGTEVGKFWFEGC